MIDYDACPGKNRIVPGWKIEREAPIYSSWQDKRVLMGTLKAGEEVTVLAGLDVTRKPDKVSIIRSIPALSLKPGDIILRYGYGSEGFANFWVKGAWQKDDYFGTTEKDGSGCRASECESVVMEDGIKESWVQVKTNTGAVGWTLVAKSSLGIHWFSGNFSNLCAG